MSLRVCLAVAIASCAAAQTKVEIDNPWVRVIRAKDAPHSMSVQRERPPSVVVYLTDARERVDGAEITHKAGDVVWLDLASGTVENLSDKPVESVVVQLKPGAPKTTGWPVSLDPVKLDPAHHLVPLENDRVRVLRTILEPHLKGPTHEHPSYVVVYLTVLHTTMTLADGKQVDNPRRPGDIAWRDAYRHTTENVGDQTAEEIQIELK